ncbi:MAG: hypothetical protein QNK34_01565 [Woeseiaceae bacterium]|nr:hypothetical protein [Woeseiaceae bacterium]
MKIKTLFAITLLSISFAAAGQVVSQAYEVAIGNFRAPVSQNGVAVFKECDDCESRLVRVTPATRYSINGKSVQFDDFRKTVGPAGSRRRGDVIVLHHLESDTIESITVSL